MAHFGHDPFWPQPLTWPIWAGFGRAGPILANFAHPPWLGRFGKWLLRFVVAGPIWANGPLPLPFGPPSAGPPSVGPPSTGPPKILLFFFPLPHPFSFFFSLSPGVFSCLFSSLWRCSRGILVVFWSVGTSHVLVFALILSCETPAASSAPTLLAPTLIAPILFLVREPTLSGPTVSAPPAPTLRVPNLRAPTLFSVFGPPPFGPPSLPLGPPIPSPLPLLTLENA